MSELKQHAFLLIVVAVLLLAKFVYIPIIDWQDRTQANIIQQEKKLSKIQNILENKNLIVNENNQLTDALAITNQLFFDYQPPAAFKLSQQKKFEALLSENQLSLTQVAWEKSIDIDSLQVTHYKLGVYFKGGASNVVQFTSALEKNIPYLNVSDFVFSIKQLRGDYIGRFVGHIIVNLYVKRPMDEQRLTTKKEL